MKHDDFKLLRGFDNRQTDGQTFVVVVPVPGSQGPRYLKLTFKYELDSKEGPSKKL